MEQEWYNNYDRKIGSEGIIEKRFQLQIHDMKKIIQFRAKHIEYQ